MGVLNMFKLSDLEILYIEFNGYCNRLCPWCPNSKHPRNDINKEMTMGWECYKHLIQEIKNQHKKDLILSFYKYNEPFAFPALLKQYTDYARAELGDDIKMIVNTNGDYLHKVDLADFTLDQINIMDYSNKGFKYGMDLISKTLKAEPIGLTSETYRFKQPVPTGVYRNPITQKPTTIIFVHSWLENAETLVDRGGLLSDKKIGKVKGEDIIIKPAKRSLPCTSIHRAPAIHYNGDVAPCCHIYPSDPKHKKYILGNINDDSLTNILNNSKSKDFAHKTKTMDFPDVCKTCADITHTK